MSRFQTFQPSAAGAPASFVLAWQARQTPGAHRNDWIEATMRRYEMPSLVDIAKRDGAVDQLSRLLDI